jgi:hypothetical protein
MNRAKNKIRNCILAISFLPIYAITCKAQDSFVKNTYTFEIKANSYINKTSLKINEGEQIIIKPSGIIVLRGVTGSASPEGKEGFTNCRMDPVFLYGALLYKIGEDDWEIVDPEDTIIAEQTGYLKFMVNDNDPTSNSGQFTVKVTSLSLKADSGQKVATVKKSDRKKNTETTEHRKATENISPPLSMGTLSLSELQRVCNYNLTAAKGFLTAKQFRFDDGSNDHMNKYNFNKDNLTTSVIKDAAENQTTYVTSSTENYKEIKAALDDYGYTRRNLVKKVEGVTKYANSKYSLFILSFKLNNKYQYSFAIKKL